MTGVLTISTLFAFQDFAHADESEALIVDLSGVPYMDSAGMGLVMNHYVHCQARKGKLVVVGASGRLMDLFKVTKVDSVLPLAATIEEAEAKV